MNKPQTILNVDLSNEETSVELLEQSISRRFIGGRGVGAYLLYNRVPRGEDPKSPKNALILCTGVGVGTGIPGANRISFLTKSSHGTFSFSHSGGKFPTALKRAGYDYVLIFGKAKHPVYLFIDKENVSIRDARHLWGKLVWETEDLIKEEVGSDVLVGTIGPGGENLVPFSSFVTEVHHVSAKGGAGYIAGSKNLKAIVVTKPKGKGDIEKSRVSPIVSFIRQRIQKSPTTEAFKNYGSLNFVVTHYNLGAISGYNFRHNNSSEEGIKAYHHDLFDKFRARRKSCYGCPIGCNQICEVNEDIPRFAKQTKIEWGSLCALGPLLGVFDYEQLAYLIWLCAQYGIDAKETSSLIGMLMEMYEDGVISEQDTNGLEVKWGNFGAVQEMIKATARKVGLGAVLGEGSKGVLKEFGQEAERRYGWVKGCGISGADVRADYSWGLGHALSTRGPDCQHHFAIIARMGRKDLAKQLFGDEKVADRLSPEGKGKLVWWSENYKAIIDSIGYCLFLWQNVLRIPATSVEFFTEMYNAVSNENVSSKELFKMGERIVQLGRAFNSREGFSRADDTLPYRFLNVPAPDEPVAGSTVPLSHPGMLDEYYSWRGCDKEGLLTRERLEEVDLDDLAEDLQNIGKLSEDKQVVSFSDNAAVRTLDKERTLAEIESPDVPDSSKKRKDESKFKRIDVRHQLG
jgi:aldehyde:ferredoxin oxidoreductase